MGSPSERKKATVFTEFFALALITTIGIIRYFRLDHTMKFVWLLVVGFGITIIIYQLTLFLFFRSSLFRGLFIVFAAALWAWLVFHISIVVRGIQDGLTWFMAVLTFSGTLLAYIHYHFKRLF